MKEISLLDLKVNQKGRVVKILGGFGFQQKLASMGIYQGKEITKLSHFILRGPIAIKIGRTVLALGYGMAHKILVEVP